MQSPVNLIAVLLTVSTIAMFSLLRLFNLSDPECLDKETFEYVVYELNDLDYRWASELCNNLTWKNNKYHRLLL